MGFISSIRKREMAEQTLGKTMALSSNAGQLVIKESVEPLLEEYRPLGITSLKFSKLSLGTVPPKIEGVRVSSQKKGLLTMDVDLRWGGNPSIILAVEAAHVASIPVELKDLQVFTVLRVILQLADEIPCISAVVVALLADPNPTINYTLKAVAGSLTALPGISDMIDDTVDTIITDMLQWPHRIVIPMGGTPVDTSELELRPEGKLTVTVIKANDLKNMEMIGKSDPYVVLHIRPLFKVKTKMVENNLNPVWDETFELIAEDKETQSLIVEIFDANDIRQDKELGSAKLPLIELEDETPKEVNMRLLPSLNMMRIKDKKDRGTLTIKVLYHLFSKEEQKAALEEDKKIQEARRNLKRAAAVGNGTDATDGATSMVGSGGGTGVGSAGSGCVPVSSGWSKAGRLVSRTVTRKSSRKSSGTTTPVDDTGGAAPL